MLEECSEECCGIQSDRCIASVQTISQPGSLELLLSGQFKATAAMGTTESVKRTLASIRTHNPSTERYGSCAGSLRYSWNSADKTSSVMMVLWAPVSHIIWTGSSRQMGSDSEASKPRKVRLAVLLHYTRPESRIGLAEILLRDLFCCFPKPIPSTF